MSLPCSLWRIARWSSTSRLPVYHGMTNRTGSLDDQVIPLVMGLWGATNKLHQETPDFVPHLFPHLFPHIERGKSHAFRWECSKRLNPAGPTGRRAIWSRAGNSPQKRRLFRSIRMDSAQTSRQNDMICGEHHWLVVWLPFLAYFPRNIGNLIIPIDEYFSEGWPNHQPDHVEMACLSFSFSLNTFGQIPPWSDIFFQPERKSLYIYIYMSLIASQTECQIPNRMAHHGTKNAMRIVSRLPIDFPDKTERIYVWDRLSVCSENIGIRIDECCKYLADVECVRLNVVRM